VFLFRFATPAPAAAVDNFISRTAMKALSFAVVWTSVMSLLAGAPQLSLIVCCEFPFSVLSSNSDPSLLSMLTLVLLLPNATLHWTEISPLLSYAGEGREFKKRVRNVEIQAPCFLDVEGDGY
jgi:hypothetical protein